MAPIMWYLAYKHVQFPFVQEISHSPFTLNFRLVNRDVCSLLFTT